MITPLGWLERVPTYKDQIEQLRSKDLATHGFLGYPVLQTADIAIYRADLVPVGEDQASHLEICREIVRRFNGLYGAARAAGQLQQNDKAALYYAQLLKNCSGSQSDRPELRQARMLVAAK